jgi:hypothetical protein
MSLPPLGLVVRWQLDVSGNGFARQALEGVDHPIGAGVDLDRRYVAPENRALGVDDVKGALAGSDVVAEHPVAARHFPLGVEIREERKAKVELLRVRHVAQRESQESPKTFAPRLLKSGRSSLNSPSSLVQTGVKSPG